MQGFEDDFKIVIHTDQPDYIRMVLEGLPLELRRISSASTYVALQNAHADAVAKAQIGDKVVLLNADIVISGNLLSACAKHFKDGKLAIVTSGIRTALSEGVTVPIGAKPAVLLNWAWEHRHRIIRDLEWGRGGSMLPTNLFFVRGDSVILHGFHLHPVAIHKVCPLPFQSTIDGDLLDFFSRDDIHVVTDPDDLSMLEISDPKRRFPCRSALMTASQVAGAMQSRASPMHRWLFDHRIIVRGSGKDRWDEGIVREVQHNLDKVGSRMVHRGLRKKRIK